MVLDRRVLLALVPGVVVVALDWAGVFGKLPIFVLAAAALIPLAWLIGEATDNAAFHTGPGIGGFLNASFGNAPELIIALVAVSDGLTDVVRASLVGSVVGNLLLVLGFTLLLGQRGTIDRRSAVISLGLAALATVVIFLVSVPGFHGDPDRRSLAVLALPVAVVMLLVRIPVSRYAMRRQRALYEAGDQTDAAGWPLRVAIVVLGLATVVTAFVTTLARRRARDVCTPRAAVRVLRRDRDRRDRRERHGARQRGAARPAGPGRARDRDLARVERTGRGPADSARRRSPRGRSTR